MLHNRPASYKTEHTFLKEVDTLALANRQLKLERAFKAFFSNQTNLPNFQARKNYYGYTTNLVNSNITLYDKHIKLPKLGLVKLKKHRTIPEDYLLKSATISKSFANDPMPLVSPVRYICTISFFSSIVY